MAAALADRGVAVGDVLGRHDDVASAGAGVDVVVLAVPDAAVEGVARAIDPRHDAAVVHLSGSLGLDVLAPHRRRSSLHPLVPLPDPETGCRRLLGGATFAVAGDAAAAELVAVFGGRTLDVDPAARVAYHAAATIAANHLVALLGQVERVAASAGLPFTAFVELARAALDDVAELGPARALTGPAARGDLETLSAHRRALDPDELDGYNAGVALARRLAADRTSVEGRGMMADRCSVEGRGMMADRCSVADRSLAEVIGCR